MASPFAPPLIDFSALGKIPESYYAGQTRARESDFRDALSKGNFVGPNGELDYGRMVQEAARLGNIEGVKTFGTLAAAQGKGNLTDEIKEYNLSKSQGFTGSFTDWKTGLKKAGATKVEVNTGEKEYDKVVQGGEGKRFLEMQGEGRAAVGQLGSLDIMEKATNDPQFYSGVGAERFVLPIKQAVTAFGGDPKGAASMEVFRAQSSKAALDSMGGSLGSGFSNADRDFVLGQVASLANTPEGNRDLISINRTIAQRKIEVAKLARDYAKGNKGRLDAGFDERLAVWAEKNPLFPKAAQKTGAPATPQRAVPAQQGAPVRVNSAAERDALQPGTQYIAPDGSLRTKQ